MRPVHHPAAARGVPPPRSSGAPSAAVRVEVLTADSIRVDGLSPALVVATLRERLGAAVEVDGVAEPARYDARSDFSERQAEILGHLVDGMTNRQIARTVVLSEHAIKYHLAAAYRKMGVGTRAQAVRWLLERRAVGTP